MPDDKNYVIGDLSHDVLGDISFVSRGETILIDAAGDPEAAPESTLILNATTLVGMFSGPAAVTVANKDSSEGEVCVLGGVAGSIKLGCGMPALGPVIIMEPEKLSIAIGPPASERASP